DRETLVRRKERGLVESVEWAGALRRWAQDYAFTETNRVWPCLAPRGLPALLERLRKYKGTYAVTASLAVPRGSAVAPPSLGDARIAWMEDKERAWRVGSDAGSGSARPA